MKMKKGLGSIPKSLSWIDYDEPAVQEKPEKIQQKKTKTKTVAAIKTKEEPNPESIREERFNQDEICTPTEATSSLNGLPAGWTRATFIVKQELNEKLKALAYWDRVTVKEVVHEALSCYLQDKNVRAMPKKKEIV